MATIQQIYLNGESFDIHLTNGNIFWLDFQTLLKQEQFAQLAEGDRIYYPKTDGTYIFWEDGPRLTLDEAIALLGL